MKTLTLNINENTNCNMAKRGPEKTELKKFIIFLVLGFVSAFIFEEVPRFVRKELFLAETAQHIWEVPGIAIFFFVWYGLLFSTAYFIYRKKPIWQPVLFGIVVGLIAETYLFQKMSFPGFFLFIFLYAGMFWLPFKLIRKIYSI